MESKDAMKVLGYAPYGCYLMTVSAREDVNGMPLSLFMQAGFTPPLVACGVKHERKTHGMVREAKAFAVVFLRKDQKELVDRFKKKGDISSKFEGLSWERAAMGSPVLSDCLGWVECKLTGEFEPGGEHTLFVGEVRQAELVKPGPVLTIEDLGKVYRV